MWLSLRRRCWWLRNRAVRRVWRMPSPKGLRDIAGAAAVRGQRNEAWLLPPQESRPDRQQRYAPVVRLRSPPPCKHSVDPQANSDGMRSPSPRQQGMARSEAREVARQPGCEYDLVSRRSARAPVRYKRERGAALSLALQFVR